MQHFQNSSLLHEDKRCRPILFHTNGSLAGEVEQFPGTLPSPTPTPAPGAGPSGSMPVPVMAAAVTAGIAGPPAVGPPAGAALQLQVPGAPAEAHGPAVGL